MNFHNQASGHLSPVHCPHSLRQTNKPHSSSQLVELPSVLSSSFSTLRSGRREGSPIFVSSLETNCYGKQIKSKEMCVVGLGMAISRVPVTPAQGNGKASPGLGSKDGKVFLLSKCKCLIMIGQCGRKLTATASSSQVTATETQKEPMGFQVVW